jgi:hypothetical protein
MKRIHLGGDFMVPEATVPLLITWENFYVIVGTAAATLTGLMFVVITLSVSIRNRGGSNETLGAFSTPNVVHFCIALLIAALLSAPWSGLEIPGLLLSLIGLGGTIYTSIVLRRFVHQRNYKPVLEDWAWHVVIPLACYIALFVVAIVLLNNPVPAMFFIGTVTVLFLFVGIHNAWDTVTYISIELPRREDKSQDL